MRILCRHIISCAPGICKEIAKEKYPYICMDGKRQKDYEKLIRQGVTAIISDRPDVLNNVIISDILKKIDEMREE